MTGVASCFFPLRSALKIEAGKLQDLPVVLESVGIADGSKYLCGNLRAEAGDGQKKEILGEVVAHFPYAQCCLTEQVLEAAHLLDEYTLAGGKRIYLLGEGRLINLAAAEGRPRR